MKNPANKLLAVMMFSTGVLTVPLLMDITFFIFFSMISVPLFFAKKNWTSL